MKIGMMSRWNTSCGVSMHTELVGRAWVKMGNELRVFSFLEGDFHGYALVGTDEEYVIRCFGTPARSNYLNPLPFLKEDYDFFVAQDLGMLPRNLEEFKENLRSIFEKDERYQICREAAKEYAEKNSSDKIAKEFLELFQKL